MFSVPAIRVKNVAPFVLCDFTPTWACAESPWEAARSKAREAGKRDIRSSNHRFIGSLKGEQHGGL